MCQAKKLGLPLAKWPQPTKKRTEIYGLHSKKISKQRFFSMHRVKWKWITAEGLLLFTEKHLQLARSLKF